MSKIEVLDVSNVVPTLSSNPSGGRWTFDSFVNHLAAGRQSHPGSTADLHGAERNAFGHSDAEWSRSCPGRHLHRHRPDDGGAMISRRILVISRSPALSRSIQASLGPGYQVVTSANVIDVLEEVREQGPFDVLVAGPLFDSHAGMARLAQLRNAGAVPAVVLALGPKPKATMSDIVRTGAIELVEYPTSKRQLSVALQRAFELADVAPAVGAVMPVTSHSMVVERPQFAEVYTVASSSGGCGKTFYATNLACYLAAQTGQRVCLVDLDLQFGEVSTALHLRPRFTISDLLAREPVEEDDLDEHVEEYLLEHDLGFSVLAAPFSPAEADMIAPKDVYKVMAALRKRFDYIVVDTPAQLSEVVLAAFDHSTKVLCMVTLDLPSIRNMRVFLSTLEKLRINSESIGVVLNKVEDDVGINDPGRPRCTRQQDHFDPSLFT